MRIGACGMAYEVCFCHFEDNRQTPNQALFSNIISDCISRG